MAFSAARGWFKWLQPRPNVIDLFADSTRNLSPAQRARIRALATTDLPRPQTPTDYSSFGGSGTPLSGVVIASDDYNRALQGRQAVRTYDQMRRGDAQVHATLQILKLPILQAQWEVDPPENADTTDQEIADFVQSCLIDDDAMRHTWDYTLRHMLLKLDFGYSLLEKVWTIGPNNELRFHRLAPRLPISIEEWRVDDNGELIEVIQRAVKNGREQQLSIPGEYCAVFVNDKEGDNFNGISALRSAYKHWYYKDQLYNIDAISHERWGVGIPRAKLQEGAISRPAQLSDIESLLDGLRAHERAYIVQPPKVEFDILTPVGTKGNTDLMRSVEHHDVMIARNILAPFLNVGQAAYGTRSSTGELADVFFTSLEGLANGIGSECKRQLVKPLCDFNFPMEGRQYPTLRAKNLRKVDVKAMAEAMQSLSAGGFLTPDETIENAIREIMGYPPVDPQLRVTVATANAARQLPGSTGQAGVVEGEIVGRQLAQPQPMRVPTDLEQQILSLSDIPRSLDVAVARLTNDLTSLRTRQVSAAVKRLVAVDSRNPGRPFSDLRPDEFGLPFEAETLTLVRKAQQAVSKYGAEQVRLELKRQGAPVALRHPIDNQLNMWSLDETLARAQIGTRPSIRAQLDASARATAERLNTQLRSSIIDEGLRARRSGLTGGALERAMLQQLEGAAGTNVAGPVRGEINEAFGMGRAAEAYAQREVIAMCVQSALLDQRTCTECDGVDGLQFAYGSAQQIELQPPYINCQGRENCRCVQLFVYSGNVG